MPRPERLSALDAAFLDLESATVPFVIGSILCFDRRIDLARLRAHVDAALDGLPRYRQRLGRIPLLRHPVWIDDGAFTIDRHVRAVPAVSPGSAADVERVAADLLSRRLPGEHPPWQLWLMDTDDGASAIIAVVHHSLVDGVAGVHLLARVLSGLPDHSLGASLPPRIEPRPTGRRLLAGELASRARNFRRIGSGLSMGPLHVARAAAEFLWQGLHPASDVGLNPRRTGGERTIATCSLDLELLKSIRRAHGVTLNDVILTGVAGALRALLVRRGVDPARAGDMRAMVPVSTERPGDPATSGNKVAMLLAPLAVDEADPVRRLARVAAATSLLKGRSGQRDASELLVQLSDATTPALLTAVLRIALAARGFNVVITNIPGPPFPLYLMGARLDRIVPIVNLWPHGALGVAVMSYAGRMSIGLHADRAIIADLEPFARDLISQFAELAPSVAPGRPPARAQLASPG